MIIRKNIRIHYLLIVVCALCFSQRILAKSDRQIPILNFSELSPHLNQKNDTTYIINFWATWCVPCRKELPEFEKIHNTFLSKRVKVLLVSLDFPSNIEKGLLPFLARNGISSDVIVLNDPKSNYWINQVDSTWSGSLPATLIYNRSKRVFIEKELDYNQILEYIKEVQ